MASRYGPDERKLLESVAGQVYSSATLQGRLAADDPQLQDGGELHAALTLLVDLGLLVVNESGTEYLPVDPASVQTRVVVPLSREGSDLLRESAEWAEAFFASSEGVAGARGAGLMTRTRLPAGSARRAGSPRTAAVSISISSTDTGTVLG